MKWLIIPIACLLAVTGCKKNSTGAEDIVIISDSFEIAGQPSHLGWQVDTDLTSGQDEAPPNGGQWSLRLDSGTPPFIGNAILDIYPNYGSGIYEFSVWVKTTGTATVTLGVLAPDDQVSQGGTVTSQDTAWTQVVIVDTLTIGSGDQIFMELSSGSSDSESWYSLFDLARLVKKAE